ncbi:uncharacterized protein LOC124436017 isoform X2 [Xenia sp. Carnegie-2017]|uniref:uncharacterized protein LOC124436017 isoform X2 n=1 Tax=Xenia sp. Carnegie-2017 TaxID=2897299 RepID=UPI001F03ED11|nr:uncharacterized protein LOC124436017 isoform X2 [Xenia sp. Carnegie-2017]
MRQYGFNWPEKLQCKLFPKRNENPLCLRKHADITVFVQQNAVSSSSNSNTKTQSFFTTPPTSAKTSTSNKCEDLTIPICKNLGYNKTFVPNRFFHETQEEAAAELHKYWPLISIRCSSDLKFFLCSQYAPVCNGNPTMLPCRSICEKAKNGCMRIMRQYGYEWPKKLQCKLFPKRNENPLCLRKHADITVFVQQNAVSSSSNSNTKTQSFFTTPPTSAKTSTSNKCEDLTIPICKNLGYNKTFVPNRFFHETQEEAAAELHKYWPLISIRCSSDLKFFLCSQYAPVCNGNPTMLPCRSICEKAKNGCMRIMRQYGYEWPKKLQCKLFPKRNENPLCLRKPADITVFVQQNAVSSSSNSNTKTQSLFTTPPTSAKTSTSNKCEDLTIPICKNLGYNKTFVPNRFFHETQEEAAAELHQFWPLISIRCSSDLKFFLCSQYAPVCNGNPTMLPCRSICEKAKNGCMRIMRQYGYKWPKKLQCKLFPKRNENPLCLRKHADIAVFVQQNAVWSSSNSNTKTQSFFTTPPTSAKTSTSNKCEDLAIPMCKNLGYNKTFVPNRFFHETQAEAAAELHQFWPLISIRCSSDLKFFLCSQYAPVCNGNHTMLPCRSICEKAKNGCIGIMRQYGFKWPEKMQCKLFPNRNENPLCLRKPADITVFVQQNAVSSSSNSNTKTQSLFTTPPTSAKTSTSNKCEDLAIPMCKNLGYNKTFVPNRFFHETQAEAAAELHQFWPLISIRCSSDLKFFLCSQYAPVCNGNPTMLPCRSICEKAKNGCMRIMRQYGYKWPKKLQCKKFPKRKEDLSCLRKQADIKVFVQQNALSSTSSPR